MDIWDSMNSNNTPMCSLQKTSVMYLTIDIILVLTACKLCHIALSRFGQPRIISEFLVGLLMGLVRVKQVRMMLVRAFPLFEGISASLYMFVLGLEMEPMAILRPSGPEAKIAYAGIVSTWSVFLIGYMVVCSIPYLNNGLGSNYFLKKGRVLAAFAVMISATSSPIVTRLVTELKLGQSEIGRRTIRAGLTNDLFCTLIMCIIIATRHRKKYQNPLTVLGWVVLEMLIVIFLIRLLLDWVNKRNPEGLPIKGLHMFIVLLAIQILCHSAPIVGYDIKVNSFLIGLAIPRQGRVSNVLIGKINYALSTFVLPLYMTMAGLANQVSLSKISLGVTALRLLVVCVLVIVGKLSGTVIVGINYGLHWLEAVTIGLLLNIKGYFLIIFTIHGKNLNLFDDEALIIMMSTCILSIVFVPKTVSFIIDRARMLKGDMVREMSLQWHNPEYALRVTVALYGPHNVGGAMVLVETMRGRSSGRSSAPGGIIVYALDMVEISDSTALVYRQDNQGGLLIADNKVIELRKQIGCALDYYMQLAEQNSNINISKGDHGLSKVTLRRTLAASSFSAMHEDVCCSAQDSFSVLIVLPFHKSQLLAAECGSFDDNNIAAAGHPGIRSVNQKVLEKPPCSIAILVDRGLGNNNCNNINTLDPGHDMSTPLQLLNVVVVFIGGADDREALACAGIIADHPSVHLMVMRIILDTEGEETNAPGRRLLTAIPVQEMESEMKIDDEYFAEFYNHFITNGHVRYTEKHVKNGIQAVAELRNVAQEDYNYQLFIVGQGRNRSSLLTAGLGEWAECPELGPIGDILASSDFPTTASILVVQQHNPERDSSYLDEGILSS